MTTEEILKDLPRNESSKKLVSEWLASLSDEKDETISGWTVGEGSGHTAEDELTDSGLTASWGRPRSYTWRVQREGQNEAQEEAF